MHWNLLKAGFGIIAVAASCAAQAGLNGITVTLAADKPALNNDDDVVLRVTFTNTSATPQYVLKWHTPFAGIEDHLVSGHARWR